MKKHTAVKQNVKKRPISAFLTQEITPSLNATRHFAVRLFVVASGAISVVKIRL